MLPLLCIWWCDAENSVLCVKFIILLKKIGEIFGLLVKFHLLLIHNTKLKDFQCFCCDASIHCSVVCEDEKQAVAVKSQLQQLARPMYSNPPVHGALVVSTILGDPNLKKLWLGEVKVS